MSKPIPARFRTTNWSSYTASLRKRGLLLIWLGKDKTWLALPDGKSGRPAVFSDAAIQFCLTIKGEGRSENSPGEVQAAAQTDDRDGGQPAGVGRPGLGRA
jgi:hypothetical protein